jgi:hypothetical protein
MKKNFSDILLNSAVVQIPITLITYAFYASIIGLCLVPGIMLIFWGVKTFLFSIAVLFAVNTIINIFIFALILGASLYLYFITGIFVMGIFIRILSLGIKPGKYSSTSLTMLRWLIYSGIFMIVVKTILPLTAMTFFSKMFFKILGCKMGKNVYINTPNLNDPQFLELGSNVVIGGLTNISCHTFEGNNLVLGKIKIGDNTLIGTNCYIMPNVKIGNYCNIGMYSYIRKGQEIPDKTFISAIAGLPIKRVVKLERGDL